MNKIKRWNQIESFIVPYISSYLEATDLCRLRTLNQFYHRHVDQFLLSKYKTVCIENFICPKCGCFFNSEEITYPYYYDILYGNVEEIESQRVMLVQHYLGEDAVRKTILCERCEMEEDDEPEKNILKFPFRGSNTYHLYILRNPYPYQWAIITTTINGEVRWNQYRCFIPIVPIYEINLWVEMQDENEEDEEEEYYVYEEYNEDEEEEDEEEDE